MSTYTVINGRNVETIEGRMAATDVAVAFGEDWSALGFARFELARNAAQGAIDAMVSGWTELERVAATAPGRSVYGDSGGLWLTAYQVEQVRAQLAN